MAKEDAFEPQPNGTVKFVIDGLAFSLRRPKIKEFRNIRENLIALGADSVEEATEAAEAVEQGKLPPMLDTEAARNAKEDLLLDWWRLVFDTLGDSEKELPSNDDLPLWLFDSEIIPKLLNVWMRSPLVRGANQ